MGDKFIKTVMYLLSRDALNRMQEESPDLAISFYRFLNHLIAERLVQIEKLWKHCLIESVI